MPKGPIMKKISTLILASLFTTGGFAQRAGHTIAFPVASVGENLSGALSRTTGIGSTDTLSNIAPGDSLVVIKYTSRGTGYVAGTNSFGDKGFAEFYNFNGRDSSIKVIGVLAQFGGKVTAASTKSVNFKVWGITGRVRVSSSKAYEGFPNSVVIAKNVPITQLGVGTTRDTLKAHMFDSASITLNTGFFVGYDISYNPTALNGDTIGLASSRNGRRTIPQFHVEYTVNPDSITDTLTRDTIYWVQNATQFADDIWHENYTDNDSIFNNLAIFPIVRVNAPTGLNSVTAKGLTFFGNYPNPAQNTTNVKFALADAADVTVSVLDMSGKTLFTQTAQGLASGEHIVPVSTEQLPAGSYLYTIKTSTGGAIASQFSVVR